MPTRLAERYRRLNANTRRFTIYIYRVNPGVEIMEYWCTENEKDAKHMVGK